MKRVGCIEAIFYDLDGDGQDEIVSVENKDTDFLSCKIRRLTCIHIKVIIFLENKETKKNEKNLFGFAYNKYIKLRRDDYGNCCF